MQDHEPDHDDTDNAVGLMHYVLHRGLSLDTMSSDDMEVNEASSSAEADAMVTAALSALPAADDDDENYVSSTTVGAIKDDVIVAASSSPDSDEEDGDDANELEDDSIIPTPTSNTCSNWNWLHIIYLSLFSTAGVTLRAFMGRFFGGDCESNFEGDPINDWLWPVSHRICITASGRTEQYGGALFLDLPANMFGSFIMGFMTSFSGDWPAIPCLAHDHPLQDDKGLHVGIKTALCGTLTTFSSWNSQMVLMMDGTANPYLGSQVLAAIFGYILGLQASLVSFRAGRTVSAWFHVRNNPNIFDSALSKRDVRPRCHHNHLSWMTPVIVFICIGALISLYVLGDIYWGIPYYRQLWISCLVAPIGTILRWKLSMLNGRYSRRGLFWFPTGTFLANFLGSILSAALAAWAIVEANNKTGGERWEIPAIKAVSIGIAGSLSTVSTFAKECVEIAEKNVPYDKKAFFYSHGTMISCCLVGLLVYSPMVQNL